MIRVAVTGLGVMSPFGAGMKVYWNGLAAGVCAIRPLSLVETDGFRCRIAAEVPDILGVSRRRSRGDALALAAAREALDDAGLTHPERRDAALVVGAVGGGMLETEAWYWRRRGGGAPAAAVRATLPSAHAETLAYTLGLEGPRESVVAACSSGAAALAMAHDLIVDGRSTIALAGGADAITRICYMGFNALRLLDAEPCRPFDRDRRGMSIGEGAGFVVLEALAHARARGARIYAELAGYGMTTDAFHPTSPDPEGNGMVRAMCAALAAGGLCASDVGYVNAHGTGTVQNDRIEARAIHRVFGEGRVLVSASKSMIGHTMAAAGSLEAIATILSLGQDLIPPTAHLAVPDPEVRFDCVPGTARHASVQWALSNSFGFGGQNVTLLLGRP